VSKLAHRSEVHDISEMELRVARIPIPVRLIRETGTVIIEGIGGDATFASSPNLQLPASVVILLPMDTLFS